MEDRSCSVDRLAACEHWTPDLPQPQVLLAAAAAAAVAAAVSSRPACCILQLARWQRLPLGWALPNLACAQLATSGLDRCQLLCGASARLDALGRQLLSWQIACETPEQQLAGPAGLQLTLGVQWQPLLSSPVAAWPG